MTHGVRMNQLQASVRWEKSKWKDANRCLASSTITTVATFSDGCRMYVRQLLLRSSDVARTNLFLYPQLARHTPSATHALLRPQSIQTAEKTLSDSSGRQNTFNDPAPPIIFNHTKPRITAETSNAVTPLRAFASYTKGSTRD